MTSHHQKRLLSSLTLLSLFCCRTMPAHETGFLNRTVTIHGRAYPYAVYVPRNFDRAHSWPVILFLHGSGERGTDGLRPMLIGIGPAIRSDPDRVPAIVVFPQAPPETRWLGEPAEAAIKALDQTIAEYRGDPERLYLTGLSMGGYGAYHLALAHPGRFAALVIVCGGLLPHETTTAVQQSPLTFGATDPYAFVAHALGKTPVWIFHGENDGVIPVFEGRQMAEELRSERAGNHYTEYAGVGHNAWERAYKDGELWTWLFNQRLPGNYRAD